MHNTETYELHTCMYVSDVARQKDQLKSVTTDARKVHISKHAHEMYHKMKHHYLEGQACMYVLLVPHFPVLLFLFNTTDV